MSLIKLGSLKDPLFSRIVSYDPRKQRRNETSSSEEFEYKISQLAAHNSVAE